MVSKGARNAKPDTAVEAGDDGQASFKHLRQVLRIKWTSAVPQGASCIAIQAADAPCADGAWSCGCGIRIRYSVRQATHVFGRCENSLNAMD